MSKRMVLCGLLAASLMIVTMIGCGKVIDFSCRRMAELEGNLAEETGFTIKDHLLEFTGYCQNCRKDLK